MRMCSRSLLRDLINKLSEYARSVFNEKLKGVILYGSYARGDQDDESDIDVMIIVDMSSEELAKYRWDISCFTADLNVENDVLMTVKLQSLAQLELWKDTLPFYQNVLKDGIRYA